MSIFELIFQNTVWAVITLKICHIPKSGRVRDGLDLSRSSAKVSTASLGGTKRGRKVTREGYKDTAPDKEAGSVGLAEPPLLKVERDERSSCRNRTVQ